jgi:type I restriction enzyme S subunit
MSSAPQGVLQWVNSAPSSWTTKRLKYTVRLINDKIDPVESDLQYLGLEDVQGWTGRKVQSQPEPQAAEGLSNHFQVGDVLFGKLRPYLAKVYRAQEEGLCTGEMLVLRPGVLDSRFLAYLLLTREFISAVDSSTYGSKMPRANWEFIGNLSVVYPARFDQCAIADFLDRETERIDVLLRRKESLVSLLREKRSILISEAVTRGVRSVQGNSSNLVCDCSTKRSNIPWAGDMPQDWKIVPVKQLAKPGRKTFTDGDWIELPFIADEGMRLIQTGNVGTGSYKEQGYRYISEESFDKLGCTEIFPNDVLICRLDGPVGRACIVPDLGVRMITSVDNTILKVREDVEPRFVVYLMSSEPWLKWIEVLCRVGGGFRVRVSRKMLGDLRIPLPSHKEQVEISNHLDQECDAIECLISRVETACEQLREYRSALIFAAVTGQIDVRNYCSQEASAVCQ